VLAGPTWGSLEVRVAEFESRRPDCVRDGPVDSYGRAVSSQCATVSRTVTGSEQVFTTIKKEDAMKPSILRVQLAEMEREMERVSEVL
jgi:hypothetical protein